MYTAKAEMRPYFKKPLGEQQKWYNKIAIGLSLLIIILVLIAGPMLLFSTINPVTTANPVVNGELQFYI